MITSSSQLTAIHKAIDAFNRHDAGEFAQLYAPDAIVYDPQYPEPLRDLDSIEQDMKDLFRAFPDIQATRRSAIENGELVAIENSVSGTHTVPLALPDGELVPTSKGLRFHASHFFRFDARGNVVEDYRYYDIAGWLAQLGVTQYLRSIEADSRT
jgi:steroid delta-isomerase-like uncharacterized protein